MKFNILSDLHLEWYDLKGLPGGDNLLLCGDILMSVHADKIASRFFAEEVSKYKNVYYIMGNHEYYGGCWQDTPDEVKSFTQKFSNVTFLNNETVFLSDDTVLFGGTLWTDANNCNPWVESAIMQGMNDFVHIKYRVPPNEKYQRLHISTTIAEHYETLTKMKEFLDDYKDKKVIIMTHMAPSSKSSHPRFGIDNPLNYHYFSNLENIILDNPQIKLWCHGHTHDSHDYMIGETRVVCNPRGYTRSSIGQENSNFDINKTIEVI